jgi:hypothetical protein
MCAGALSENIVHQESNLGKNLIRFTSHVKVGMHVSSHRYAYLTESTDDMMSNEMYKVRTFATQSRYRTSGAYFE